MSSSRRAALALLPVRRSLALTALALAASAPLAPVTAQGGQRPRGGTPPASASQPAPPSGARATGAASAPADTQGIVPRRGAGDDAPVVARHSMRLGGEVIRYTSTTGMLPIRNEQSGETEGNIFFVAYTKDGTTEPGTRPLMFIFNGGPGSASVWLHMGAFGPKKVRMLADGALPPPPYTFEDNQSTLLDQVDMVFLDPVGTGYSRATSAANGPKFWGLDEDARSVAEFVRLYLTRYERWGSPLFLAGESYGTMRAAHLAGMLTDQGIVLNGVALISTVLNYQFQTMAKGNDIAFVNFLPSYAVTAWYHKQLAPELQARSVEQVAREAEEFATGEYAAALMKGARLTDAERRAVIAKMARLTGLPEPMIRDNDLRITLARYNQELLRDERRMVARLDSRFTGFNIDPASERTAFDPSEANIRNVFTPVLNDYVRRVLGYKNDNTYYILGGGIGPWRYPQQGYANVMPSLERAFNRNPYMKLYVAMGYYDNATPYYAAKYTLDQLVVDPAVRAGGIRTGLFAAGHMMYIDEPSMKGLRTDMRSFITDALRQPPMPTTVSGK